MEEAVDGEYQAYKANDGAFVRQHFFGKHDELKKLVSNLSDEDIWRLNRGGHDPHKVFAAYHQASNHQGQLTVILCKTVKVTEWGCWRRKKYNPSTKKDEFRLSETF